MYLEHLCHSNGNLIYLNLVCLQIYFLVLLYNLNHAFFSLAVLFILSEKLFPAF